MGDGSQYQTSAEKLQSFYREEVARSKATNITEPDVSIPEIDYCFSEDKYLEMLKGYIDKTYGQHYAQRKIQSTEFIMDANLGHGFCAGNIIKYIQRYGKKDGYNKADLLKVCHYAIMMLFVHDTYHSKEEE